MSAGVVRPRGAGRQIAMRKSVPGARSGM